MEKITDHADRSVSRLLTQYRSKPRLEGVVRAFGDQIQAIEDALWQLLTDRLLDSAVGAQLDVLGGIVRQTRQGYADSPYREHIRARIRANRSGGTLPEVIDIMAGLILSTVGGTATTHVTEHYPRGFVLKIGVLTATETVIDFLLSFLRAIRAGGIRAIIEWFNDPPADTFTWDGTSAQAWDTGKMSSAKS